MLALGCALACAAGGRVQAGERHAVVGAADIELLFPMYVPEIRMPASGAEPDGLRDAIAAALLATNWEEFGVARDDALELGEMRVSKLDDVRWTVSGEGIMTLGRHGRERIGFRFTTEFDGSQHAVARPKLDLGGVAPGERMVLNDPGLIRLLEDELLLRFAGDLGEPNARLRLDRIESAEVGLHLLRISAEGLADFGQAGTGHVVIEALLDVHESHWRMLDYRLSSEDGWQPGRAPELRDAPSAAAAMRDATSARAAVEQPVTH